MARLAELQGAVRDAIDGDDLRGVLRKLHSMALAGDATAARVLLERVLGRAREADPSIDVELPADLASPAGIAAGLVAVAHAAASGRVPADVADRLASIIERVADASVVVELARRVEALESPRP